MSSEQLLSVLVEQQDRLVADLERFVTYETPSEDKERLDAFANLLVEQAAAIGGAAVDLIPDAVAGNHVRVGWTGPRSERPVLLLGHYDTVWPAGTTERLPFRRDGDRLYGPGAFDMKAGLVQALWAVRTYRERGGTRPIVLFVNSDEETGSVSSRPLIEAEARRCQFALVLEPALEDGKLKTARRGVARYRIAVRGRASHAGLAPDAGISAVKELCHLVLALQSLADPALGTAVNVGRIEGGTRFNVIPARAHCDVAFRMGTLKEAERLELELTNIRPQHPGATIDVRGGILWPPMERTPATAELAASAIALAAELGFGLGEGRSGGASDACHCAAVGAPVLDGLGAVGGGAHTDDEHVLAHALPLRTALLVRLLETYEM